MSPKNNMLFVAILFSVGVLGTPVDRQAQAQTGNTSQESSPLVEGLLDLLGQPDTAQALPSPAKPAVTPEGIGLDGEDLGEQSDNPLESVRQTMLIAADYLRQGFTNTETQQLQSDIVLRLDELIAEIEQAQQESQQQAAQQPQESQSESSPSASQPLSGQGSPASASSPAPEGDPQQQPAAGDAQQDTPGQKGAAQNAMVDLADPRALQQSVWGQLPEQVRKQMQSRMVERFLPSYREQIEAYFQALLEGQ